MKNGVKQGKPEAQGINLREIWRIALKRKWIVIATTLGLFAAVTLATFLTKPMYTAGGQIIIEREPNILSFEDVFQIETFNDDYYQTQYKLLQSRALAADTIDRMRLYENREFAKAAVSEGKPQGEMLKNDPLVRRRLIDEFESRLSIRPVRNTRLVEATYTDRDPKLAAETLNALFEAYVEMNIQRKYQATAQATDFLANQIETVRTEIEVNEKKLQEYGKEKNILALSNSENTVIGKLGELNKALTDAQIDRINKETYYNEIRMATPDFIPNSLNNTLVQTLAQEYNRLYRDYVKRSETFLPDYPEIQSLKAELNTAKKALEDETQNQINRAYTDFQAALSRERAMSGAFDSSRRDAFQLNSNAIQYNSLLIQIQNQKNLLESLMTRKSETDVSSRLKGLRTSNIWIVDRAEVPLAPSSPNKRKNMTLGLIIGLFAGLGLALLFENLDNTVKNGEDVAKFGGAPLLGMVPAFSYNGGSKRHQKPSEGGSPEFGDDRRPAWTDVSERSGTATGSERPGPKGGEHRSMDLLVHFSPESSFAEQYRSIRTTLLFSTLDTKLRALAVTSPFSQEGKTTTTCNFAIALAQAGKRVAIIDADLRKPRLHKVFRVKNLNGLSMYLTTDLALEDLVHATPIPSLFLINSGPVPPNPLELLGSEKVAKLIGQLKKDFDFILVDTPPVLPVSDALVIGSRLDGAILIVRGGCTHREALRAALEKLEAHNIKSLGVIINGVR
ncbi:MAG TPA: polysaccharide biosynthesis tyrosine autokinase, partial [Acidobacteriota bacterium]|nr:polysaccharide biosynthesis tyrosine autokinase [Acidobacteriota bacterium]